MFEKIDISNIINEHWESLRSLRTGKRQFKDWFTFVCIPCFLSIILVYNCNFLDKDKINIIIAALAIFAGFLFNLIAIVYGFMDKLMASAEAEEENLKKIIKRRLIKEIHSNISFNILISIFSIIALLLCFLNGCYSKVIFHLIAYFFLGVFLTTLLMVLNRIHILLKKEFEYTKDSR